MQQAHNRGGSQHMHSGKKGGLSTRADGCPRLSSAVHDVRMRQAPSTRAHGQGPIRLACSSAL
eukprot:366204-Chlamydomonas_euryale.AAC.7